jgi:hypothetical protein
MKTMRTDGADGVGLEDVAELRRLDWELGREEHSRDAAAHLRERVHDLMNLVQIVEIAAHAMELAGSLPDELGGVVGDLSATSRQAKSSVRELAGMFDPAHRPWTTADLRLLLLALRLDKPTQLVTRVRPIEDGEVYEILCSPVRDDSHSARFARGMCARNGCEITLDGGELAIAIPVDRLPPGTLPAKDASRP